MAMPKHNGVCYLQVSLISDEDRPELLSEPLTWFEEDDGPEAAALGHVGRQLSEAAEDVLDGADVAAAADAEPGLGVGRVEQGGQIERQVPLGQLQQEQVLPRLLQQQHLAGRHREYVRVTADSGPNRRAESLARSGYIATITLCLV